MKSPKASFHFSITAMLSNSSFTCVGEHCDWASTDSGRSFSIFENEFSCQNNPRWKKSEKMKHKRFISAWASLMLIFMSWSCMSLIYLLLIFRGIFSFLISFNKFFYSCLGRSFVFQSTLNVVHVYMLMFRWMLHAKLKETVDRIICVENTENSLVKLIV